MKAEITENGTLRISPESGIENFALKAWWEKYSSPKEDNYAALHLHIDLYSIQTYSVCQE